MCPEIPSHARLVPPDGRPARHIAPFALPSVFWIALTLATPIAGLVGLHFFGHGDFGNTPGNWAIDALERWLMLASAALVLLLHVVMLVMLLAEPKQPPNAAKPTNP